MANEKKFGRNYILTIQRADGQNVIIKPPFTVEFDIHRNSFSSQNVASFRIYNLNANNRNQIRKDQYTPTDFRKVAFAAGYGDTLAFAFVGNLNQAWSVREGTDYVTQIESYDSGYAYMNAVSNVNFAPKTEQKTIIEALISSMSQFGVTKGAVGAVTGASQDRGTSISGNTIDAISTLSNQSFYTDNQKAYVIHEAEALDLPVPLINADSGLLGTPMIENQYIQFDMLFEPGITVSQLVNLQSQTFSQNEKTIFSVNGLHKVISVKHRGVISGAVCGDATTTLGLLPGRFNLVRVST